MISIHAPAWGATGSAASIMWKPHFNPRTRMGCDTGRPGAADAGQYFNPRTRMGCDDFLPLKVHSIFISIHAPAWGATQNDRPGRNPTGFQSTHPHGVRHPHEVIKKTRFEDFNPRTRMGCDKNSGPQQMPEPYFNPRTRMGCDPHGSRWSAGSPAISIHAPAWGATNISRKSGSFTHISIHAPAWGATCHADDAARLFRISIHAPAWGATSLQGLSGAFPLLISIHAPAWGATDRDVTGWIPPSNFNPRTRMGCD